MFTIRIQSLQNLFYRFAFLFIHSHSFDEVTEQLGSLKITSIIWNWIGVSILNVEFICHFTVVEMTSSNVLTMLTFLFWTTQKVKGITCYFDVASSKCSSLKWKLASVTMWNFIIDAQLFFTLNVDKLVSAIIAHCQLLCQFFNVMCRWQLLWSNFRCEEGKSVQLLTSRSMKQLKCLLFLHIFLIARHDSGFESDIFLNDIFHHSIIILIVIESGEVMALLLCFSLFVSFPSNPCALTMQTLPLHWLDYFVIITFCGNVISAWTDKSASLRLKRTQYLIKSFLCALLL